MGSSYAVQVLKLHETLGEIIDGQTVVYADSELEARVAGAEALGVPQNRVRVALLGAHPTDSEMNAQQRQILESRSGAIQQ